jgi:hypothetical protein
MTSANQIPEFGAGGKHSEHIGHRDRSQKGHQNRSHGRGKPQRSQEGGVICKLMFLKIRNGEKE